MKKAKIVSTLGPASSSEIMLEQLIAAGVDVFRFNFSHGTQDEHSELVGRVRMVAQRMQRPVAILQDLQGPKIRVGKLAEEPIPLEVGEKITITTRDVPGDKTCVPTTYESLPRDVKPADRVLLDDGNIELIVREVFGTDVVCEVVVGGDLKSNKGINLPGVRVSAPSLTSKDRSDLEVGIALDVDYVALSFVREPDDVREVQHIIEQAGKDIPVIAKLERSEAIDRLDEILEVAGGVMVARGDLGVEVSPEDVPVIQKRIILAANQAGVLVITATQMLESMTDNPRPTRAEASDVANAIFDGTDAVMLSGETAVGKYPVRTVEMMSRIIETAEASMTSDPPILSVQGPAGSLSFPDAIGQAAAAVSAGVSTKAIVAFTQSGATARLISKRRPRTPIVAFTPSVRICRQLCLCWGTEPRLIDQIEETDRMVAEVEARLLLEGSVRVGDTLVILAGAPITAKAETNLLKLHRVGGG
ncbi:MAG: pyruvate kinase [Candidatus Latescibacteria bacterium]|nr:pyruvate kinase [Candidatus Latescibacterota bacterium]